MPFLPTNTIPAGTRAIARVRPSQSRSTQSPEDEDSLLRSVGDKVLSGIGKAASFLDLITGASSVRDTVAGLATGNWSKYNPFDQFLSPFTQENRASGRDVGRELGFWGANDPNKWEAADFGAFGLELGLDPGGWFRAPISALGALNRGGQVAKRAGVLDDFLRSAGRGATSIGYAAGEVAPRFRTLGEGIGKRFALSRRTLDDLLRDAAPDVVKRVEDAAIGMGTTLDAVRGQKLGGALGVGLPFRDPSFTIGGEGPIATRFLKGLDVAGDVLRHGNIPFTGYSPGRHAAALFGHGGNKGIVSRSGQESAQELTAAQNRAVSESFGEIGPHLERLHNAGLLDNIRSINEFRAAVEGASGGDPTKFTPEIQQSIGWVKNLMNRMLLDETEAGLKTRHLDDVVDYLTRYKTQLDKPSAGFSRKLFSETHPSQKHRSQNLRGIYGGTKLINEASIDPELSGVYHALPPTTLANDKAMRQWSKAQMHKMAEFMRQGPDPEPVLLNEDLNTVAKNFLGRGTGPNQFASQVLGGKFIGEMRAELQPLVDDFQQSLKDAAAAGTKLKPSDFKKFYAEVRHHILDRAKEEGLRVTPQGRVRRTATHIASLDPQFAKTQTPLFANNPLQDVARRVEHSHRAVQTANMVEKMIVDSALSADNTPMGSGWVSVRDLLKGTQYTDRFKERLAQAMDLLDENGELNTKALKGMFVSPGTAETIRRLVKPFSAPEEVSQLVSGLDKFISLFKTGVTSVHPSFHTRNFISGQVQNWLNGVFSFRSLRSANDLVRGREIKGAAKFPIFRGANLTDAEATKRIRELAFQHQVIGRSQGVTLESLDSVGHATDELRQQMPGLLPRQESIAGSVRKGIGDLIPTRPDPKKPGSPSVWDQINPLNVRGVGTETKDVFKPAAVGREIGEFTEEMNRLTPFIEQLRKGVDPETAAQRVKDIQVDYSNLTDFERTWMRRAFPFYSFTRGISGHLADTLTQNPSGAYGAAIRAQNAARGDDPGTPEYIQQTASIPVQGSPLELLTGDTPAGVNRYLTGLGLMHEDPLSLLGSPQDTVLEGLSRLNPLLKAPIESAVGESFFQRSPMGGRELTDMDPTIGRLLTNIGLQDELPTGKAAPFISRDVEFLVGNSPLARMFTSARQITDPRKGLQAKVLNLGTGLRVSDVSEAAREGALREQAEARALEQGASKYLRVDFKGDELTPEQAETEAALRLLERLARQRKKLKKAMAR